MEPKKISFGFSKLMKKPNILLNKEPPKITENKVQLIDCLEEKSIKVVGGNESITKGPLVIPMKQPNKKLVNLVDLVKNNFVETVDENGKLQIVTDEKTTETGKNSVKNEIDSSQLSLEEQAALELLNASKKIDKKDDNKRVINIDKDKFVVEGEKESSLDDYEDVPIEEFGKAMLRGMGWKDGCGIGKNEKMVKVVQPAIRPKGMGLGADKITKQDPNNKPAVDRDGKVLKCVKKAYVKIIAGYHKGSYGQIMGLDDESGRFIIKTAINNLNISLNEFLVVPVTKEEYNKNSKIINNAKYEEYMKNKEEEEKLALTKEKSKKYDSDAVEGTSNKRDENYRRKNEKLSDSDDDYAHKSKRKEDNKYRGKPDSDNRKHKDKQDEDTRTKSRNRKNKYDSDDEYKRDRKVRSSKKYSSDVSNNEDEREHEDEKKYKKKSSKRDDDYSKKKHKKKKSKKYYSDSEDETIKHSKSHKRDKKDKSSR